MGRRGDSKDRSDISETVEQSASDMSEKGEDLDTIATDMETVRETLAGLDFGGTTEGGDAVEMSIHGAEDVTDGVFDGQDAELESIQGENEACQEELDGHSDSVNSDLDKISDGSSRIQTGETVNELLKAKEAALQDIDFLTEHVSRAREARDESEQAQEGYRQRIKSGGGR